MNRLVLTFALLGLMPWAHGDPAKKNGVQFHAFGALNPITTTDNNLFGQTDDNVSADFWELGVNASWRPRNDLMFAGQLTARSAGENDDGSPRIDYALIDYTPIIEQSKRAGFRVGRVLNPLGFYNETRDVAFTRTSILLPQSIYFDRTRDLGISSDGVQLYTDIQTDVGDFIFQANIGLPRTDEDSTERAFLGADFPGDLDGDLSALGRLIYERDGGRWRFGVSGGTVNVDYDSASIDPLPDGDIKFQPLIFSGQYNAEKYSITTEFGPRRFKSSGFGAPTSTTTGESFYIEGLYRFSPKWETYLRYDVLYSDRDDKSGEKFAARDPRGRPAHSRFAKDLTAGVTWRINKSVLLRAEYHYVNGTAWLPTSDNPDPDDTERYWSIFAFQAAVRY